MEYFIRREWFEIGDDMLFKRKHKHELETLSIESLSSGSPGQIGWKCKTCGKKILTTGFYYQQNNLAHMLIQNDIPLEYHEIIFQFLEQFLLRINLTLRVPIFYIC